MDHRQVSGEGPRRSLPIGARSDRRSEGHQPAARFLIERSGQRAIDRATCPRRGPSSTADRDGRRDLRPRGTRGSHLEAVVRRCRLGIHEHLHRACHRERKRHGRRDFSGWPVCGLCGVAGGPTEPVDQTAGDVEHPSDPPAGGCVVLGRVVRAGRRLTVFRSEEHDASWRRAARRNCSRPSTSPRLPGRPTAR